MSFAHLHVHSQGSFAVKNDGCAKPEELIKKVAELGMPAVGLTDHGSMIEVISALNCAQEYDVKVIPGIEAYVVPDVKNIGKERYHLTLLAISDEGLTNLYRLHYEGWQNFHSKPNVDPTILAKYSEGVVCLSGCPAGMFSEHYRAGRLKEAIQSLQLLKGIYGDRFYGEMQRIGIPELDVHTNAFYDIFNDQRIKPVVTNDVHFINKGDNTLHDICICINKGGKLWDKNRVMKSLPDTYLKSPDEMKEVFSDKIAALNNTLEIVERCNISPLKKRNLMPSFVVPSNFECKKETDEEKIFEYLVYKTKQGLKELYSPEKRPAAVERCKKELSVIKRMGFSSYFLIVADFIQWAETKGIPIGLGRGSAAGSSVVYCLKITKVIEPIEHGLIFERFLNEGRVGSPPDIDIDIANEHRQTVIQYVREKYGEERVAIIGTMGTFKPKTCIRDVARVMGLPESLADQISKCIPDPIQGIEMNFEMAFKESDKFNAYYQRSQNPKAKDDYNLQKLFKYAMQLEGNIRHVSKHAAGVVIAPEGMGVSDFLPVMIDNKDKTAFTAVDMHTVEDAGALKMDFLGLKTLDKIHHCMLKVGYKDGYYHLIKHCNIHDKKVYDLVYKEQNTIGVFQFEKEGMRGALKAFGGNCFNDLIVVVSAMRPGPKDEIPRMADVKWGRKTAQYDHPLLEPILRETYGVILYQEQAIQIFVDLGGFTAVEADLARRAIGKKKPKEMEALRGKFYKGCSENKINSDASKKIFEKIEKFAAYSFNKSHAAAYAGLSFFSGYCKAYHPAHWMAECFNFDNFTKFKLFIEDCRKMGIPVLPPTINCSKALFSVEKFDKKKHIKNPYFESIYAGIEDGTECIRFGYELVKNVSSDLNLHSLKKLPYVTIFEFVQRNDKLDRTSLEWLAKVGAFDDLGVKRNDIIHNLDRLMALQKSKKKDAGQKDLMDFMDDEDKEHFVALEKVDEPDVDRIRLAWEMEGLGYGFTTNFANAFKDLLEQTNGMVVKDIVQRDAINSASFLGMVYNLKAHRKAVQNKETGEKSNKLMFFLSIGDFEEKIEVGLFEDAINESAKLMKIPVSDNMFQKEDIVCVKGTKQSTGRFITESITIIERN